MCFLRKGGEVGMSIQVNDFRWEPGKNDAEYIRLLESSRDEWQKIAQKAISKLKTLSKAQEPIPVKRIDGKRNHLLKCGGCNANLTSGMKFCPQCGCEVKWE